MTNKKKITTDNPKFRKMCEAADELGQVICKFITDQQVETTIELAVLTGASIRVIEMLSQNCGEDQNELLASHIEGLMMAAVQTQ